MNKFAAERNHLRLGRHGRELPRRQETRKQRREVNNAFSVVNGVEGLLIFIAQEIMRDGVHGDCFRNVIRRYLESVKNSLGANQYDNVRPIRLPRDYLKLRHLFH